MIFFKYLKYFFYNCYFLKVIYSTFIFLLDTLITLPLHTADTLFKICEGLLDFTQVKLLCFTFWIILKDFLILYKNNCTFLYRYEFEHQKVIIIESSRLQKNTKPCKHQNIFWQWKEISVAVAVLGVNFRSGRHFHGVSVVVSGLCLLEG